MTGSTSSVPRYLHGYLGALLEESIDQTMLRMDASERDYLAFVEASERYRFRSIVVPLALLPVVVPVTRHTVGTVAGFPNGYVPLEVKLREIDLAASGGAREVDVVMNTVLAKSGRWRELADEVSRVVGRAREYGLTVKVILETSVLRREEVEASSRIVEEAGADFVKTNTGFGTRGVLPSDVVTIRSAITGRCGIKASGGIRTALDAALLLYLGARVIGTSHGIEIVEESRRILRGT